MSRFFIFLYLLLFLSFLGCSDHQKETVPSSKATPSHSTILLSQDDLENLVEVHKDDLLVLNFWATWCAPCVEELPDLAKIQEVYASKGLKLIAISTDLPTDAMSLVQPFWEEMGLSLDYYVLDNFNTGDVVHFIDPNWNDVIPTTYIIKQGNVVEKLIGATSFDRLEAKLKPLL